ncbi:lysM domain-containing GPI-anchored protein LYP6-like [Typha angustifolia]|uniref:lysM domain-containing GPI-anchored protein LYP6-like n=1 Tax=Typha angustifolia TaxID=59011 RepID=UPI003C30BC44
MVMPTTLSFLLFLSSSFLLSVSKSTIQPCTTSSSCPALLGYTLYTDLKVSEVAALFQADPLAILAANSLDFSLPSSPNSILPSGLFLRIPTTCSCSDGIYKSVFTRYTTRPADSFSLIADSVFAGLVSADQIQEANGIADPRVLDAGTTLVIPLPCVCFNSTDNFLPAVYLSYVVRDGDTVASIAASYSTTTTDIMNVNSMGSAVVSPGDIIAIPLPACASTFPMYATDYGLVVANGTYAITAGRCVQCSCGPGDLNLYCTPASLAASCSSMQCSNSNLIIGNFTSQPTSGSCSVTSCNYNGSVNGSIITTLATSFQPQCPGQHQFPPLSKPPTSVIHGSFLTPSPSPMAQAGGSATTPRSSFPFIGVSPAYGPAGSTSGGTPTLEHFGGILSVLFVYLVLEFVL